MTIISESIYVVSERRRSCGTDGQVISDIAMVSRRHVVTQQHTLNVSMRPRVLVVFLQV